ncbi:MAG TPA: alpha/beta hydrolase [Candidatus Angelobacter sp.]|nr:alpha/beta hydrolase [Candidatus Angelobacter sp.]
MHVTVNNIRLFFDVEGAKLVPDGPKLREMPTLLCLHGGPGLDHSTLKPVFSSLADVAQVIYLDQRGHGRSDRSSREHWTLAQWADDVREFCHVLGIENPIVLGISFGGYVAMTYAIRYPDHPAKLVLMSTALRGTGNPVRRQRVLDMFEQLGGLEARETMRRAFDDRSQEAFADFLQVCGPLYTRRSDPDARARTISNTGIVPFFERAEGEGVTFDYQKDLSVVRCPTLVIGGEDDPMTPITEMEEIIRALPSGLAIFEKIPDCGHGIYRDAPERLVRLLREFLGVCEVETARMQI